MGGQILLIDDDLGHAGAVKTYLERTQYDVTIASCTTEVFECLDNSLWDIILGDLFIDDTIASRLSLITEASQPFQIIAYGPPEHIDLAMDLFDLKVVQYLQLPLNSKALDLSLRRVKKQFLQIRTIKRYSERLADLHTARNHFNQLFNEVPCYISVQNKDLRITASNKRFKRHFGNSIGGYCYQVYKHRGSQCENCPVVQTFKDGKMHSTEEIVTSVSGKQYNVLTQTAPIKDEKGDITQVMEMSSNITQIRQLQDHLTSLGLMLGSMSHGVKGMLTALDGGLYQLETGLKKKDEPRIDKAFEQIQTMTNKIKKMVLEILYYAKTREHRFKVMDLKQLVDNISRSIVPLAQKNNVRFKVTIADAPGVIEVNPDWMEAALVNFLENAIEACSFDKTQKKHWVTFRVKIEDDDCICLVINDNGIGMDQETREKMFTLFFTSKGSMGTGLGLFIANSVVKQHGGNVDVQSIKRQGTTFTIHLPRKQNNHTY